MRWNTLDSAHVTFVVLAVKLDCCRRIERQGVSKYMCVIVTDSDVELYMYLIATLGSAQVTFDVFTGPFFCLIRDILATSIHVSWPTYRHKQASRKSRKVRLETRTCGFTRYVTQHICTFNKNFSLTVFPL